MARDLHDRLERRRTGPDADAVKEADAERKALYIVAAIVFALAAYII